MLYEVITLGAREGHDLVARDNTLGIQILHDGWSGLDDSVFLDQAEFLDIV